jgi:hypothetical protein
MATGGADDLLPSTARIHRWARRHGGHMAAGGARATVSDAGDWVSQQRIERVFVDSTKA